MVRIIIKSVDYKNQIFSSVIGNRVVHFYLTNRLAKIFLLHLSNDILVDFEISNKTKQIKNYKAHHVAHFNLIKNYKTNIVIYDHKKLKLDMIDFLSSNKYYLFLDLEMTMPFFRQKDFIPEIVQYGYLLVDDLGKTVLEDGNYVKTKIQKNINKRTIQFLNLNLEQYNNDKISFNDFYENFSFIMNKYKPKIVVWGKNDIQALSFGYEINKVKPLTNDKDFVDLLKLHKDYFNLKNDLGLFKAYETYYNTSADQAHDAKDDAQITKKVFDAFMAYSNLEYNN